MSRLVWSVDLSLSNNGTVAPASCTQWAGETGKQVLLGGQVGRLRVLAGLVARGFQCPILQEAPRSWRMSAVQQHAICRTHVSSATQTAHRPEVNLARYSLLNIPARAPELPTAGAWEAGDAGAWEIDPHLPRHQNPSNG